MNSLKIIYAERLKASIMQLFCVFGRVENVLSGQLWEKVVFASGNDKVGSGNGVCLPA